MGLILLAVAALTDMADGMIARRILGQKSIIGSVLDPIADKTLVLTATGVLYISLLIPSMVFLPGGTNTYSVNSKYTNKVKYKIAPVAFVIVGRDIGLIIGSLYYRYEDITLRVRDNTRLPRCACR